MSWSDVQSAIDAANAANESRYQNILSGYQSNIARQQQANTALQSSYENRYNRIMGGFQGYGDAQRLQLGDQYGRQLGQSQQQMLSRGLGNTTLYNSNARGVNSAYNRNMIDLNDSLTKQRTDMDINLSGQQLGATAQQNNQMSDLYGGMYGFMERRNDVGPDLSMYAAIAKEGMGGAGGGGIGGFGATGGGGSFTSSGPGGGRRPLAENLAQNYARSYRPMSIGNPDLGQQQAQISAGMNSGFTDTSNNQMGGYPSAASASDYSSLLGSLGGGGYGTLGSLGNIFSAGGFMQQGPPNYSPSPGYDTGLMGAGAGWSLGTVGGASLMGDYSGMGYPSGDW